ncbi:MAG: DNA internalization-related competence protein ComEC/Rec2 [Gammaproteobacteria bacterium]
MLLLSLSLLLGATYGSLFSWTHCWAIILCLLCIGIAFLQRSWIYIMVMLMGLGSSYYYQLHYRRLLLPANLETKVETISGCITTLPRYANTTTSFVFQTPIRRIWLNWYQAPELPHAGDCWRLQVRLKRPHGYANWGSYNRERWFLRHDIHAQGYVYGKQQLKLSSKQNGITHWRSDLYNLLHTQANKLSQQGLLLGLMLGERSDISPQQWQILSATATSHLLAISGLHVGLVAAIGYSLGKMICWLWPSLCLIWPRQRISVVIAWGFAFIFSLLTGMSVATQRALIMFSVAGVGLLAARYVTAWAVWAWALCFVIAWDLAAPLDPGFWLSFSATAIILFHVQRNRCSKRIPSITYLAQDLPKTMRGAAKIKFVLISLINPIITLCKLQLHLWLLLLPLTISFFHRISLVALPANLIAIPWISFLVQPLCLLATLTSLINPALTTLILTIANWNLAWLWHYLQWLSHWQVSQLIIGGLTGLLSHNLVKGDVSLTVLDVGQGLASVIQTQHHALIFDTGPRYGQYFDAGHWLVLPYLQFMRIKQVDKLIVSHNDQDHLGGAQALLTEIPVQQILQSQPTLTNSIACHIGQSWRWDNVSFKIISPTTTSRVSAMTNQKNNRSCVLVVSVGNTSMLLPGDIEYQAEQQLIAEKMQPTTILVAPHHGSRTSSSARWVKQLHPSYVVFATGYRNRFHFPHNTVKQRYARLGAQLFNTAYDGAVSFLVTDFGRKISVRTKRVSK